MKTAVNVTWIVIPVNNVVTIRYDKKLNITYVKTLNDKIIEYNDKPFKVISLWCLMNGSTIEGRMDAFKSILNISQKCPIYVTSNCILIPSLSINNDECIYVNFHNIFDIKKADNKTKITFINGKNETVDISYHVMHKQMNRVNMYLKLLYKQKYLLGEGL